MIKIDNVNRNDAVELIIRSEARSLYKCRPGQAVQST